MSTVLNYRVRNFILPHRSAVLNYRVRNFILPHRSACGPCFPLAREIQRPVRETVTPAVLEKVVWAGANLNSFPQASAALCLRVSHFVLPDT